MHKQTNQNTFQQKLGALASFPDVKSETVRAVGNVLEGLSGWELFRINPLRFAEEHKFEPSEIVNLFVHGAKIGLFDLGAALFRRRSNTVKTADRLADAVASRGLRGGYGVLTTISQTKEPRRCRPLLISQPLLPRQRCPPLI